MGYHYECGYDVERDFREPWYVDDLKQALRKQNPKMSDEVIAESYRLVTHVNEGTLEQRNEQMMDYLQNGVEVKYVANGRNLTALVRLIDFEHPTKNLFKVCNQWRVVEHEKIRCDIVVFVNGVPIVVIELKSPANDNVEEDDAYLQIKQYQQKCPSLFVFNAFSVTSDLLTTKAGTLTAKQNRYMEWKSRDGVSESAEVIDYETFFEGIFRRERLIDILQNFLCFDHKDGRTAKIMAAYHQYFAVNKAVAKTCEAVGDTGKIGVFWHTQGSGKSLSMVFYVHRLIQLFPQCTIVVVTDRNDLDQQLYEQFVALTRELTEQLRRNRAIDWNRKESARAKMRVLVKRLLKKYKYPPEGQEKALETVMAQCNKWADDDENVIERKLANVEDDREVGNLIYQRLLMAPDTSDYELQREVMEVYGERYPDMRIIDWQHVIADYTSMVREAAKQPSATIIDMQQRQYGMAAEPESNYNSEEE